MSAPYLVILCTCECARAFVGGTLQVVRASLEESKEAHQRSEQIQTLQEDSERVSV